MTVPWGPTTLYRLYDASGQLLYLGITSSPTGRFTTHACEKVWWDEIATIRLEHYETRKEALAAESAAIVVEAPLHNMGGNPREDRIAGYRGWRMPRGTCSYCGFSQALDATGRIRWHKSADRDPVTNRLTRYSTCPGVRRSPAVSA